MKNTIAALLVSLALVACGKGDASKKSAIGPAFDEIIAAVEGAKGDCAKVASALEAQEKKHRATFEAFNKSLEGKKKAIKDKYKDPKDMGKVMEEMMKLVPPEVMEKGMKMQAAVGKCSSDEKVRAIQKKFKGK